MKYRSDIDGLRAIAVLPVLLFHAKFQVFGGGFVGVDVFFVISGYLITSLIVADLAAARFSIVKFYERRVRRIIPALFAVTISSALMAYHILTPPDLMEFGQSLVATTLFSSNLFFWLTSGYFDTAAEQAPLLHTWSLAVEEQFYIVFPILLIIVSKAAPRRWVMVTIPIAAISLLSSVWATRYHPSASFYLAPTRAWELMLGAMLATATFPAIRNAVIRQVLGAAGLALIAIAVFSFSSDTPFPGLAALIPCIGAALIIHTGEHGASAVGRMLGSKPLVFVGLISYSLYLWHWPLLLFGRYYLARELTATEAVGLLGMSFIAATLSWRFVETPFRRQNKRITRKAIFVSATLVAIGICFLGTAIHLGEGYTVRFNITNMRPVGKETYNTGICLLEADQMASDYNVDDCRFGDKNAYRTIILWGDSHAAQWARSLSQLAQKNKLSLIQANLAACPPLISYYEESSEIRKKKCWEFNERIRVIIENENNAVGIILAANWAAHDGEDAFHEYLSNSIAALRGRGLPVFIVGQIPTYETKVPIIYQQKIRDGEDANFALSRDITTSKINEFLENNEKEVDFTYLPHSRLCDQSMCRIAVDGALLYWDSNHLSVFGSEYLIGGFVEFFSNLNINKSPQKESPPDDHRNY